MEWTLGYGVTPSSGGVTAPSTSQGGMSGYVPPLQGLTTWGMPPLEDAIPPGPVTIPLYQPPVEAGRLRSMMSVRGIVPQAPQMPTPICQLPLFPQSRQATSYQQQLQPPSKSSDWESPLTPQPPSLLPLKVRTPMYAGDQLPKAEMIAISLPATPEKEERGPLSGRPICRCLARRVGATTGAPHNPPPSSTSGSKGASTNPLESLANFRSSGWKKDLSHILRGFYLYNYPSKTEADWEKLRVKFLNHLGQCQDKWKTIKEEAPLEYMPYMEHQFLSLTGIRLQGLSQFTAWIKPGSYYHGVVAKKGQLSKCLHLARIPPPMRPQIHPSETQALTQRPVGSPTASPCMPGQQCVATQGACSDAPTPMKTGGAGDGHSWVDQVEACPEEEWRRDRLAKHP